MARLTDDRIRSFAEEGFVIVPGVVEAADVAAANAEVDRLIADEPPPPDHVGHHFYFRAGTQSPILFDVLRRPGGVLDTANELVGGRGVEVAFDQTQVALNIPPYPHRPGRPHIDGYRPGQETPGTFTLLACVFLSDQERENGGNLWVWPGTHSTHAEYFAAARPDAFAAAAGTPDVELPEPTQVRGRSGDVVLAHYLLGHNIGGNDEGDRIRRALYWRLRAPDHAGRWAECLVDPWVEFPRVRTLLSDDA